MPEPTDKERLEWLENMGYPGQFSRIDWGSMALLESGAHLGDWFDASTEGSDYSPTLRIAIDRAMKAQGS
jgi:hypothetical protein